MDDTCSMIDPIRNIYLQNVTGISENQDIDMRATLKMITEEEHVRVRLD
jgi:hypothetical protein